MPELKINETPGAIPSVCSILRQIGEHAEFLAQTLETGHATHDDVNMHVTFIQDALVRLSPFLETKTAENEYVKMISEQIASVMKENYELTNTVGNQVNAEQIKAGLRARLTTLEKWYEETGFEYAHIEPNMFVFKCEFSAKVTDVCTNDQPTIFKDNPAFDLIEVPFSQELADTDKNRASVKRLFMKRFPSVVFKSFESRPSDKKGQMALRFTCYIDFKDI